MKLSAIFIGLIQHRAFQSDEYKIQSMCISVKYPTIISLKSTQNADDAKKKMLTVYSAKLLS